MKVLILVGLLVLAFPVAADTDQATPGGEISCRLVAEGIPVYQSGDVDSRAGLTGVYAVAYMAGMVSGWNMAQITNSVRKAPSYRLAFYDAETREFLLLNHCRKNPADVLTGAVYKAIIGPTVLNQQPQIRTYE